MEVKLIKLDENLEDRVLNKLKDGAKVDLWVGDIKVGDKVGELRLVAVFEE